MTLNAVHDRYLSESTKMRFEPKFNPYANFANIFTSADENENLAANQVLLKAMEIRTFLVRLRSI